MRDGDLVQLDSALEQRHRVHAYLLPRAFVVSSTAKNFHCTATYYA